MSWIYGGYCYTSSVDTRTENDCYLSASLLETDWMDRIRLLHPNGDFIFVVEGVLMYFREEQVRTFLHNITMRFEGGELWFDVCGTMMSRRGVKPDSLREHKAQIRSGIDDGHMVELWEPDCICWNRPII